MLLLLVLLLIVVVGKAEMTGNRLCWTHSLETHASDSGYYYYYYYLEMGIEPSNQTHWTQILYEPNWTNWNCLTNQTGLRDLPNWTKSELITMRSVQSLVSKIVHSICTVELNALYSSHLPVLRPTTSTVAISSMTTTSAGAEIGQKLSEMVSLNMPCACWWKFCKILQKLVAWRGTVTRFEWNEVTLRRAQLVLRWVTVYSTEPAD